MANSQYIPERASPVEVNYFKDNIKYAYFLHSARDGLTVSIGRATILKNVLNSYILGKFLNCE